jgi:serine/threonine protein kinase
MTEQANASELADLTLEPGQLFAGRFEVQRLLGQGDRKRTYLALDRKMEGLVALSLIKSLAAALDPNGTAREAKVLRRLGSNPNIVSVYDYDTDVETGREFIVFEYMGGGTLAEYIGKKGPLPQEELLKFGRQVARGLSHMHGKGLVHRDVSPNNVWLDDRYEAHLGDFDSAITIDNPGELRPLTTSAFASPEELVEGKLDARSDLFSLGGVPYVLATGEERPADVDELRARRPDLPWSFGDLVASLRAENPADRPDSAETIIQWLDDVRNASAIDDLIAAGESDTVEFKESLCTPTKPMPRDLPDEKKTAWQAGKMKEIKKEVSLTVAAFLNSGGGKLLIGVNDAGEVVGIEPDFNAFTRDRRTWDGWVRELRTVIVNALGEEVWAAIRVSRECRDGRTIAVVFCPPRDVETWHTEKGGGNKEEFYVRANNTSQLYSPAAAARYIKGHWPRP